MNLADKLNEQLKEAMKEKNTLKINTYRDIKSAIIIEKTKEGGSDIVSDELFIKIISKLLKQRNEAIEQFKAQNRADLLEIEEGQANLLKAFLPAQLSDEEVTNKLKEIINKIGAKTQQDFGKVMGIASKNLAGKADGKKISEILKKLLN